jgi:hypothetical protein
VVECRTVNPPARQPSAHTTALVEHEHAAASPLQLRRGHQPRHPGADDQHVHTLFSRVHSVFGDSACSRGKQWEAHNFHAA